MPFSLKQIQRSISLLICNKLHFSLKAKEITQILQAILVLACELKGLFSRLSFSRLCDADTKGRPFFSSVPSFRIHFRYPAMHLYLYSFLHWLTRGGVLLRNAQAFFAFVYLLTQFFVMRIYKSAGVSFSAFLKQDKSYSKKGAVSFGKLLVED